MNYEKKNLIVFGSSVACGEGTKDNFDWASLLAEQLKKRNWNTINKSVGGNRLKHLLKRVHEDVISLKPDAVIIAASLGNEGILYPFKQFRYNRFLKGIKKLIELFEANNIRTIITNVYPHERYTLIEYDYVQKMNLALDVLEVPVINVCGSIDNLNGNWLDGLYLDSAHPNDEGHLEMMTAFPVSLFDHLEEWMNPMNYNVDVFKNHVAFPLKFALCDKIRSFTICFDFKSLSNDNFIILDDSTRIGTFDNKILITANGKKEILLDNSYGLHHFTVNHHPYLKEVNIYIDNEIVYTIKEKVLNIDNLVLEGQNTLLDNILFYRGRLSDKIQQMVFSKKVYKSSLEIFSTSDDFDVNQHLFRNQASTDSCIKVIVER